MTVRVFAIVYETATKDVRRLINTSDDNDDSHLEKVKPFLAADETMEIFRQTDFPIKYPRFVKPFIGQGAVVDKSKIDVPIDTAIIADISVAAKAFSDQEIAKESEPVKPGPGLTPAQELILHGQQVAPNIP